MAYQRVGWLSFSISVIETKKLNSSYEFLRRATNNLFSGFISSFWSTFLSSSS